MHDSQDTETLSMSTDSGVDEEEVVHRCSGISLSHTEGYIMPFAATQRHLARITLSEDRERLTPCDIAYMRNLKCDTNVLIHDTETDSEREQTRACQRGLQGATGGVDCALGWAEANSPMWNGQTRPCCAAQGARLSIL